MKDPSKTHSELIAEIILLRQRINELEQSETNLAEHKRTEETLKESEERYRIAIESSNDGVAIVQNDVHAYANRAFLAVFGYNDLSEVVGKPRYLIIHPDDRERVNGYVLARQEGEHAPTRYEFKGIKKDGSPIDVDVSASTISYKGEKAILAYFRDTTERKQAEAETKRIKAAVDATGDAIGMSTPDGQHFYQNEAFDRLFGYTQEEVSCLHPIKLYGNEDGGKKVFETIMAGKPWQGEIEMVAKNGRRFPVSLRADAIKDESGKIIGLIGIHADITERKQAEEALREDAERLRTVIEAVQEGITLSDEKGHFEAYNSRMERLTGYSADEANASSDFTTLLYPDPKDREKALEGLNELTTTGMSREAETKIQTKDGIQKYALVSTALVLHKGQRWFLGSYHDITGRKRTEGQIVKLALLKERLIDGLRLGEKLKLITDGIVEIFGADFAGIWLIREGDLCEKGCIHAKSEEGPDACRDRARCLHLVASSGRYTHIDANYRRVPFGCRLGRVAFGEDSRFITNDVTHDPRVHDREWTQALGLVSFAGFRFLSAEDTPMGVTALFSKQAILPGEEELMAGLAAYLSPLILSHMARKALLKSETKFRTLFENANDAILLLRDDIFIDCNARTLQMFQCSRDQVIGQPPYRFSPPLQPDGRDSREKALEKIYAALAGEPQFFEWKHCLYDGTPFDVEVSLNPVELGSELFIQAIVRDVTERKLLEKELHRLSIVDELTGLYNRRGFLTLSEQQLKLAERTKKSILLFFLDLDHMKWINDTLGHHEGDTALAEIAAILRQTFRESDIIGRVGGDEFAVLAIDGTDEARVVPMNRLRNALENYNKPEGRKYQLSLSIGIARYEPDEPASLDELMAQADTLMYEEKSKKQH
jgi:diguanylate cyclase (GGDEF)-like protein/PAS domain S-box-containing protein